MAWDTEETRRRLLNTACSEFAQNGLDGTTMAQIAAKAGINKERLYNYFGDKQSLFETVLTAELDKLAASLPIDAPGIENIGEYTGRIFDFHADHPELARLLLWEGLSSGPAVNEKNRAGLYHKIVGLIAEAQKRGVIADNLEPSHLLFFLISIAAWWFCVPQLARMITGSEGIRNAERKHRRAAVVLAAQQLTKTR